MGNITCSCTHRRHLSDPDHYHHPDCPAEVPNHPKSTTPYDNGLLSSISTAENFNYEISDVLEPTEISYNYSEPCQSPVDSFISPVLFRSTLSGTRRVSSFFSSDEHEIEEFRSKGVSATVFDLLLREFLTKYYPICDNVIVEMIRRNLLLAEDAHIILSQLTNDEKSQTFLHNFVFSEINICRLATFLHIILKEKSQILSDFQKPIFYFQCIVDHIYYVINLVSLLAEYSNNENQVTNEKIISSMINLSSVQTLSLLRKSSVGDSDNGFYVKVVMNSILLPARFWTNFATINDNFKCCQELFLTSCDLHPNDVYNLRHGFIDSAILRIIDVSTNPIGDEGLRHLSDLFTVKNSIVSLNIACCSLTCDGMADFLDILSQNRAVMQLKHLNVSHNELSNMTERSILMLTKISLTSLEMKSINLRQQWTLLQSLKQNNSLKRIDFSGNKFVSNDTTYLASGLAYNSRLKMISLSMIGITMQDCSLLNTTFLMNKSLVSIDLSDNMIGDEGADVLKDVLTMKKTLQSLYMKRCGISVHGIFVLVQKVSEAGCKVKLLDLCYNHSPRMSIVVDTKDTVRKIHELLHQISLVKDVRIMLWGTLEEPSLIEPSTIDLERNI